MFLSKLLRAADHPYLEGANGRKVTKNNYFIFNSLNLQSCQDPRSKIETAVDIYESDFTIKMVLVRLLIIFHYRPTTLTNQCKD